MKYKIKLYSVIFLLFWLTSLLVSEVNAVQLSRFTAGMPEINTVVDIKNFAKIDDNFYRGAQPDKTQITALSKLGVKTIINLRYPFNFNKDGLYNQKVLAHNLGINYVNIPMIQTTPPTQSQINLFFSIIEDPDKLPVYVHCKAGQDRTGVMTALYRVTKYGWTYNQAYSEMKSFGYHSILFPEQKNFLKNYTDFKKITR